MRGKVGPEAGSGWLWPQAGGRSKDVRLRGIGKEVGSCRPGRPGADGLLQAPGSPAMLMTEPRAGQSAANLLSLGAEGSRGRYMIGQRGEETGGLSAGDSPTSPSLLSLGPFWKKPIQMCEFGSTSS